MRLRPTGDVSVVPNELPPLGRLQLLKAIVFLNQSYFVVDLELKYDTGHHS
jgi:hypothetical protein